MKMLVLGAGMMGSAIAYDLNRFLPTGEIVLADRDAERADRTAAALGPRVRALHLDAHDTRALAHSLQGCSVVISAASFTVNATVTRAALDAGVHMCDLGGNNDVVEGQLALHSEAEARGVSIIPNCGLAPGLINILAAHGTTAFESVDAIHLRVGGLPQHPRPPLNYQIVFSVEGLLNEYLEPAEVIADGLLQRVPSLSGLETMSFPSPYGELEAFHTSGGISTLSRTLLGKVRTLDYKTIRYRGHCEKFRMLVDLGFAGSEPVTMGSGIRTTRELFTELLKRRLSFEEPDVVLARATLSGRRNGVPRTLVYDCVDVYDEKTKHTAMMRTTAFPTAITALLLAQGEITRRGVFPPELGVPGDRMIEELARRNIRIETRESEGGQA